MKRLPEGGPRAARALGIGWVHWFILFGGMSMPNLVQGSDTDGTATSRPAGPRRPSEPADIKYKGTPTVGSRITVGLDTPLAPGTTVQWTQTEGPAVTLDDPTKSSIAFTVPAGAAKLGFLLTLSDLSGDRSIRFDVPIRPASEAAAPSGPIADAGDDQVGLVGHRTTLNGASRGEGEKATYRWFQIAGPKVERASQDRTYYTFTPTATGIYRFALIVASNSGSSAPLISEPDEVTVTVGSPPGANSSSGYTPPAIEQAARAIRALSSDEGIEQLAVTFEAISERASMYKAFAELSSEMMRRLDPVIPTDQNSRQIWVQTIFNPLTQYITGEMRAVGLDLGQPQGGVQELTPAQKERLRVLFAHFSREIRAKTSAR